MLSELSLEEFSEVVKAIVHQKMKECLVDGDMEGRAKLNLDVVGRVTAKIVCQREEEK